MNATQVSVSTQQHIKCERESTRKDTRIWVGSTDGLLLAIDNYCSSYVYLTCNLCIANGNELKLPP